MDIFMNKLNETHKYINALKNAFKELDKTEDKLNRKNNIILWSNNQ